MSRILIDSGLSLSIASQLASGREACSGALIPLYSSDDEGQIVLLGERVLLEGERPELFTLVKKHLIRY